MNHVQKTRKKISRSNEKKIVVLPVFPCIEGNDENSGCYDDTVYFGEGME